MMFSDRELRLDWGLLFLLFQLRQECDGLEGMVSPLSRKRSLVFIQSIYFWAKSLLALMDKGNKFIGLIVFLGCNLGGK